MGTSYCICELEDELGVVIFTCRGKRLIGMMEKCKTLLSATARILNEENNIRPIAGCVCQ
ncbi:hypothetical protein [Sodalis-like endosymbiont of Proechinophthirus fluctus]|uniref:hypothetical protein n=1 Tax=Sodalis-like endosymbiont of Proechinophthirus fluctus TaxID=1462730 RepID=UPI001FCB2A0F|nr:hypothetical protein [Sodalis-like endosymbiont of Proechinophthirus fluctus]